MGKAIFSGVFGQFGKSVAWKIALIALGPILGLALTLFLNQHSENIRQQSEAAYQTVQDELAQVDSATANLAVVNSQVAAYLDNRTDVIEREINIGIRDAQKALDKLKVSQDAQMRESVSATEIRLVKVNESFEKLKQRVETVGRTSNEGLTDDLDKMTEVLAALFDGAVSTHEGFRPLAAAYADLRGVELRYRWKRDQKLETRIEFMRSGLIERLTRADFDRGQADMLLDSVRKQQATFAAWRLGIEAERTQRDETVGNSKRTIAAIAALRDRSEALQAEARKMNMQANESAARFDQVYDDCPCAAARASLNALTGEGSLSALRAFESAARLGSFRAAAEELGVTPTAISHQVRGLESMLATPLFTRRVRGVALTDAGLKLSSVLSQGFDAFQDAVESVSRAQRRSIVTVGATNAFTARWLVPRLASFREAEPTIDLQLAASDEPASVVHGEVDIAIRYGSGLYPGHAAELLWQDVFAPVSNPLLGIDQPGMLRDVPLIAFEWKRPTPRNPTWQRWSRKAGVPIPHDARFLNFSDETHAIQATVAGQGVGLLSTLLVAPELASGALVERFGPRMPGHGYYLVTHPGSTTPAIEAVAAWIKARFDDDGHAGGEGARA